MAEEYARHLGYVVEKTNIRMTRDAIFTRMSAASREWGEAVSRYSYEGDRKDRSGLVAESNLAAWMENLNLIEEEDADAAQSHASSHEREHMSHPKFDPSDVKNLYRCSWCSNASAALKKCRQCEAAR